ncbi:MAG: acyl-CoA dehydrogenase family protein, partial [Actinomycetia bacterium]|nr:acyl-CoA dehydrogenase family protein [Actinomycetes bacterium]
MDFDITDEQRDIVAAFDKALTRESSIERVRAAEKSGFDPDLWHVLIDMGALELTGPGRTESNGAIDLSLVAEAHGRHLACVPLVEATAAGVVLAEAGVADVEDRTDGPVLFSPRPATGGVAESVPGGAVAGRIVVLDGADLLLVRGVPDPIDDIGFTAMGRWRLNGAGVERTVLASGDEARRLWRHGLAWWQLSTAAVAVGIARRALQVAGDYVTVREQFGVPIGSFQSIQHSLADVFVEVEGARLLVREAANRCEQDAVMWGTSAAKAYANATEVAVRSAEVGLHVHGGYGYTLEYDPQLYLRRAKSLQLHGGASGRLWAAIGADTMASGEQHIGSGAHTEELRAQVRAFVAEHLTPGVHARVAETGDYHDDQFHRALAERGWVGAHWGRDEGGQGWPRARTDVVYEELAAAGAPVEGLAITQIIGEAIRRVGTPEQKAMYLPRICRGEVLFALGYSEPASGSDLASIQTRAVRDGDGWILNGQKIFTTMGSIADHVFVLARTDPNSPRHAGLTLFLVPTDAPGFSAAPIYTLSGQRTNVTYYSDIELDDSTRIGGEGEGWEIVNVALAFERGGEFAAQVRRVIGVAVASARVSGHDSDPHFLAQLGRATAAGDVSRLLGAYASWSRDSARAGAVEGTVAKVYGTEALQWVSRALLDEAGSDGLPNRSPSESSPAAALQHLYRESQIATIYGGTS